MNLRTIPGAEHVDVDFPLRLMASAKFHRITGVSFTNKRGSIELRKDIWQQRKHPRAAIQRGKRWFMLQVGVGNAS